MDSYEAARLTRSMAMKERNPRKLKRIVLELKKGGGITAELLEHTVKCAAAAGETEILAWATKEYFRFAH